MGYGLGGDKLEEKYSKAAGKSRGAGMKGRDLSKASTMHQMYGPQGEGYGPFEEGGAMGKLRELAIARRMREIAENLNTRYSASEHLLLEAEERLADLEQSLARAVLEISGEEPPPGASMSDVIGPCSADKPISELPGYDSG